MVQLLIIMPFADWRSFNEDFFQKRAKLFIFGSEKSTNKKIIRFFYVLLIGYFKVNPTYNMGQKYYLERI